MFQPWPINRNTEPVKSLHVTSTKHLSSTPAGMKYSALRRVNAKLMAPSVRKWQRTVADDWSGRTHLGGVGGAVESKRERYNLRRTTALMAGS